ncbi:MAG: DUF2934 domain-containing protein [Phycisphaeraceae bacterium]
MANLPNGPSYEAIAKRAYEIYVAQGRPEGRAAEHWKQAEAELRRSPGALYRGAAVAPAASVTAPTAPAAQAPRPAARRARA